MRFSTSVQHGSAGGWSALCTVLLCLAAGCLLVFSYGYEPLYDTPNTGDETMSMTLAYNAYTRGAPGYGYGADLEPVGLPVSLLTPGSEYLYGMLLSDVPPLERLRTARAASRVLSGLALGLCLAALVLCAAGRPRTMLAAGVFGASFAWMFLFRYSFVYVASAARYDANGLFLVSLFWVLAAMRLRGGGGGWLLAAGAVALGAFNFNHFPFVFCTATYGVLAAWHWLDLGRNGGRGRFVAANVLLVLLAVGGAAFCRYGLMHIPEVDGGGGSYGLFLTELLERLSVLTPWGLLGYVRELQYPKVFGVLVLSIAVGVLLLPRWTAGEDSPGWTLPLALCVGVPVVLSLSLRSLPHSRFTYEPILLAAAGMPLACATLVRARRSVAMAVAVAFLGGAVLHATPNDLGFRTEYGGVAAVMDGFRGAGSVPEWNRPQAAANAARDAALGELAAHLSAAGKRTVLVNDPMFCLMDEGDLRYVMIRARLTPRQEADVLTSMATDGGLRVALTDAGASGFLEKLGLPQMEKAILSSPGGPMTLALPGVSVRCEPEATFGPSGGYAWLDEPSLPIRLYRVSIVDGGGMEQQPEPKEQ